MRKINLLFPLIFIVALSSSAFTSTSASKKNAFGVAGIYQDPYGYCYGLYVSDPNCSADLLGPVCEEFIMDGGTGWTVIYQFGIGTICWQPYYSLYPNNP